MPQEERQELIASTEAVQLHQVAPEIDARMHVDVHRIAGQRAQEEAGGTNGQGFAGAFQGEPIGQGPAHHPRNLGVHMALADGVP